jgi:hypothetical protein
MGREKTPTTVYERDGDAIQWIKCELCLIKHEYKRNPFREVSVLSSVLMVFSMYVAYVLWNMAH